MKTFNLGDRVRILTGKAAGRIGVVECRSLAGGKENDYTVVIQKQGRPARQHFTADKLELHANGPDQED